MYKLIHKGLFNKETILTAERVEYNSSAKKSIIKIYKDFNVVAYVETDDFIDDFYALQIVREIFNDYKNIGTTQSFDIKYDKIDKNIPFFHLSIKNWRDNFLILL